MSVCIASIAEDGHAIVVATDQVASMEQLSADRAMAKGDFVGATWLAMWSADDVSAIPAILKRVTDELRSITRPVEWTGYRVAASLSTAYQAETLHRAVAEYLSPYGLGMSDFLARGDTIFGTEYAMKRHAIEQFDLGIQFLVAGYHDGQPHIFTVDRRGHVHHYNKPGFAAIGGGSQLAVAALVLRRHDTTISTQDSLYAVLEAKFAGEHARGVGTHTTAGVFPPQASIRLVPEDTIETVRTAWQEQDRFLAPRGAVDAIRGWWTPVRHHLRQGHPRQVELALRQFRSEAPRARSGSKRQARGKSRA
jgi:hypothetical protein